MNDNSVTTTNGAAGNNTEAPQDSAQDRRADANRANARKSTGPRTEAGKKRSSLNALRHGLTGHVIVMPGEDLAAYQLQSKEAFDEFQPKTWNERSLVQRLADISWRLNRITALETNTLSLGIAEHADGIRTEHPEVHAALAMVAGFRDRSQFLANLSMHEHRLARERERTLKQLIELQATRREREAKDMDKAAGLLQMHVEKGVPYQPAEDGFVFSSPEIETYIRRQDRLSEARDASTARFFARCG